MAPHSSGTKPVSQVAGAGSLALTQQLPTLLSAHGSSRRSGWRECGEHHRHGCDACRKFRDLMTEWRRTQRKNKPVWVSSVRTHHYARRTDTREPLAADEHVQEWHLSQLSKLQASSSWRMTCVARVSLVVRLRTVATAAGAGGACAASTIGGADASSGSSAAETAPSAPRYAIARADIPGVFVDGLGSMYPLGTAEEQHLIDHFEIVHRFADAHADVLADANHGRFPYPQGTHWAAAWAAVAATGDACLRSFMHAEQLVFLTDCAEKVKDQLLDGIDGDGEVVWAALDIACRTVSCEACCYAAAAEATTGTSEDSGFFGKLRKQMLQATSQSNALTWPERSAALVRMSGWKPAGGKCEQYGKLLSELRCEVPPTAAARVLRVFEGENLAVETTLEALLLKS
jgi:hypothetical protein